MNAASQRWSVLAPTSKSPSGLATHLFSAVPCFVLPGGFASPAACSLVLSPAENKQTKNIDHNIRLIS